MTSVTPESLYYLQDRNIFLSLGLLGGGGDYDFLRTVGFGLFRVLSSSMLVFAHASTQCPFTFSHTVVVLSFLRQFSPFVCFLVNAFPLFFASSFPCLLPSSPWMLQCLLHATSVFLMRFPSVVLLEIDVVVLSRGSFQFSCFVNYFSFFLVFH